MDGHRNDRPPVVQQLVILAESQAELPPLAKGDDEEDI